jgi:hypothetical protein
MHSSRIILAAAAVATIVLTAPAEARRHYAHPTAQAGQLAPDNNGRFIYSPAAEQPRRTARRGHRARSRAVAYRHKAIRVASLSPESVSSPQEAPQPGTLGAYANAPAYVPPAAEAEHRGLVTVQTAAGRITIAAGFQHKIVPFIAAVVARGFKGQVHCFARGGHVRGSLHYSGNACDFAQTGWGRTRAPMYHVADLAREYGLRDGCTFRDCGHIDSGAPLGGGTYASARSHRHHYRHRRYASR